MNKPSIAELLRASGHNTFTSDLVLRAVYALYGNVGANLDERNWATLLRQPDALAASEAALRAMYQDSGYLLRNTNHLVQNGYVAAQAEITYRQMADRLGYTYQSSWSQGTSYAYLAGLTLDQLTALVPVPPPIPTVSIAATAQGFNITLNVAGAVSLSASGALGNFAQGTTLLTEQMAVREGFLTVSADGRTSAATPQWVLLGTGGADTVEGANDRDDYIFTGAGNDSITARSGNDVVVAGGGRDSVLANTGEDLIYGGEGDDSLNAGQGNDTVYGEAGNDTLYGGTSGVDFLDGGPDDDLFLYEYSDELFTQGAVVDQIIGGTGVNSIVIVADGNTIPTIPFTIQATDSWAARISGISRITVDSNTTRTAPISISLNNNAYEAGLRTVDLSGDANNITATNTINVSAETGTGNGYTLTGHAGADNIVGGAGNDTLTGGAGADSMVGGNGADVFVLNAVPETSSDSSNSVRDTLSDLQLTDFILLQLSSVRDFQVSAQVRGVDGPNNVYRASTNGGGLFVETGDVFVSTPNITLTDSDARAMTVLSAQGTAQGDRISGGRNNDTIDGAAGTDTVSGGDGADSLNGGEGNDTIDGGDGHDTINGGAGDDTIRGGDENDVINAGAGDNVVTDAGNQNDTIIHDSVGSTVEVTVTFTDLVTINASQPGASASLFNPLIQIANVSAAPSTAGVSLTGGVSNDTLTGGAGNDTLTGGTGIDVLQGGNGNDIFVYATLADFIASNTVVDSLSDSVGSADVIRIDAPITLTTSSSLAGISGVEILRQNHAGAGSIEVNDVAKTAFVLHYDLAASQADSTLNFSAINAPVTLIGGSGNDTIQGTSGPSSIVGGAGNDTITGGDGPDNIQGGEGNDVIAGDAGPDILDGGAGSDTFLPSNTTAGQVVTTQANPTILTVAGSFNVGDVLTVQNYFFIPDKFYSYEVKAGDTVNTIAAGLAAALTAGGVTSTATGPIIFTNQTPNNIVGFVSIVSYQADTINNFVTGTDALRLSAAKLNLLLNAVPSGSGAGDDFLNARGTVTTYYADTDTGATRAFRSFDAATADTAASNILGTFVYDQVRGMLYLDQSGDTTWTNAGDVRTDTAGDDILLASLGAGVTLVGTDIKIVA